MTVPPISKQFDCISAVKIFLPCPGNNSYNVTQGLAYIEGNAENKSEHLFNLVMCRLYPQFYMWFLLRTLCLECGLFFFFQLIVVHFTGVHRSSLSYPYRGYAFSPQCTHVGFSPVRFFSQWNVSEHSTHLIPSRRYTVTVIIGCLVSLSPSLCHGNESVLDQGRSLSLNLRKSRPHSLALTCSLELQQLFSTFMRY